MKYRFGKGYWRTVEEGSEREWLLGNGIGGFSNCTVVGNLVRTQSSYLVASLNPPVDRVNILSKIKEELVIEGRHDPCIVQRAVPVIEAVTAIGILDLIL